MKKKFILFLGKCDEVFEKAKDALTQELAAFQILPTFIFAKDGATAALMSANQNFNVILIDTNVPRLMDGGFVYSLHTMKTTKDADLIVINSQNELSAELQSADQFLDKPYDWELLRNVFLKALVSGEQKISEETRSSAAVDVRILNAMIKATSFVVQQFGCKDIKMLKPETKKPETPWQGEVASYMEIKSQNFKGILVVSFEKSTYLKLLSEMLGEPQTEITADNADAIGEINNMILGNAKSEFTQYKVEMTLPKIMKKGENPPAPEKSVGMIIPFQIPEGKLHIEVVAHPLDKVA